MNNETMPKVIFVGYSQGENWWTDKASECCLMSNYESYTRTDLVDKLRQELEAVKVEYESRVIWMRDMCDIIGYNNYDGFHSMPSPHDIAKRLVEQRDTLLKRVKVLREALENLIRADNHNFGCSFNRQGNDPDSDYCTCGKSAYKALTTPSISNLAVVSLEELRGWPCGCRVSSGCCDAECIIEDTKYVCMKCGQITVSTRKICPRCKLIEQMEKQSSNNPPTQ